MRHPLLKLAALAAALAPAVWLHAQTVSPVAFSAPSGPYGAAFDLALSCPTPGAAIRYTLDGSDPAAAGAAALSYSAPVRISQPTVVRACAEAAGLEASPTGTRTYLFAAQVAQQGTNQTARGMPAKWDTLYGLPNAPDHNRPYTFPYSRPADYAVDSRITQGAATFAQDLQTLPAVSLVMNPADLFSKEQGIYANSSQDWRRAAAVEWLEADGTLNFRATCSARILGDLSRREDVNVKHGFMLHFDRAYGPAWIDNTVFPASPARRVNRIALRSVWGDSWLRASATRATLLRDQFGLDSFRAMGHPSPDGRFVNLYVNGLYWGVYQATERPEDNWLAELTGFGEEQWDIVKGIIFDDGWTIPEGLILGDGRNGELVSGTIAAWNALFALANSISGTATNAQLDAIAEHLDLDNFIDYMILNMYAVNWDWPQKNWYAACVPDPAGGPPLRKWTFIPWDTEAAFVLNFQSIDPAAYTGRNYKGPALLWRPLWQNKEFAARFGDRVQRHYFGAGAMTPAAAGARFNRLSDAVSRAIIGESARWGDYYNASSPYTRAQWLTEVSRLRTDYFPQRTGNSLGQFKNLGLYPAVEAPQFAVAGGEVAPGFAPQVSAPAGTVYYTTDGTDPRLRGGAVNPAAAALDAAAVSVTLLAMGAQWKYLDTGADAGTAWTAPGFDDASWPAGPARLGYGGDGEATVVSYGGNTQDRHITTYFRTTFELPDPSAFSEIRLHLVRDDGAVVYINGAEVVRSNMPDGVVTYQTRAAQNTSSTAETQVFEHVLAPSAFTSGVNTVAVSVHQDQPTSSDLGFALSLIGVDSSGQGIAPLSRTTTVKARALSGASWSALAEAVYALPALVITEIMSNSSHAGAADWFELTNTGAATLDLTGYTWEDDTPRAPRPAFPAGTSIGPVESIIVSNSQDTALFRANWGLAPSVKVVIAPGPGLGNGDAVKVYDGSGALAAQQAYPDHRSGVSRFWFTNATTDGDGFSATGSHGAWRAPSNGAQAGTDIGSPGAAIAPPAVLPPQFVSPATAYGRIGLPLGFETGGGFLVEAVDNNPAEILTITIESGPAFLQLAAEGNGRARLVSAGDLLASQAGAHTVVLRVRDNGPGQLSTTQTLTLNVHRDDSPVVLNEYNGVAPDGFLNGGDQIDDLDGTGTPKQDVFFGRVLGNGGNWIELAVTGAGTAAARVDLRGWRIEVSDAGAAPAVITLAEHAYLAAVPAGTLLTLIDSPAAGGKDTSSAVNRIDLLATEGWAWTNIYIRDPAFVNQAASTPALWSVGNSDTRVTVRDRAGAIVFGPSGEGVPVGGAGVSALEVFKLSEDPVAPGLGPVDPRFGDYRDGTSSSFGAPNAWTSGGLPATQNFAATFRPGHAAPVILNEFNAVGGSSYLNGGDAIRDGDGRLAPAFSQDSWFGRMAGNGGDWFELVVTGDGGPGTVDLRGWRVEITNGPTLPFDPGAVIVLSDDSYWAAVPAGTILTFIENGAAHGGVETAIDKVDRSAAAGWRWTNIRAGDPRYVDLARSSGFAIDPLSGLTSGISIDSDNTRFIIRDAAGRRVFGPAGEGVAPRSGLGDTEVFELEADPSPLTRPTDLSSDVPYRPGYDDGASGSTFGAPNLWDGNTRAQDFSRFMAAGNAAYAAWVSQHGLAAGQAGFADSPAGDGIPNLVKFMLGAEPLAPGLPQLEVLPPAAAHTGARLRFPLRLGMAPLTIGVDASTDLVIWRSLGLAGLVEEWTGIPAAGFSTVTIEADAAGPRQFLRVTASP